MRLLFTRFAQTDLLDIAVYIAQDNPARAESFVSEIETHCQKLLSMPSIGTPRPELGDAIRFIVHGRYLIFYKATDQILLVIRILHASRDIETDSFAFL